MDYIETEVCKLRPSQCTSQTHSALLSGIDSWHMAMQAYINMYEATPAMYSGPYLFSYIKTKY